MVNDRAHPVGSDVAAATARDELARRHDEGRQLHEEACTAANCTPGVEHPTRADVLAFLHGSGPLTGLYWGERPMGAPLYWWRRYLPVLEAPIPMVLHCPACGVQHIDQATDDWPNPPHRSHLCGSCGAIWRPCDLPTVGVERVTTVGKSDNWPSTAELIVKPPGGGTGTGVRLSLCPKGPLGWRCTRVEGHDGPCATVPC
jgi:hypothetical protein